ncbi:dirigent protein 24-like [Impatiens glandulifera]|uniref:dirigent protein 24-like n=1 Tax=Impatiens glandulifera TaxID=253017 RepID=UPI001FB0E188|nr:dirigent protein 24-like [Impatiens glandulifera]
MATNFPYYIFLLALTIGCTSSARFLDEVNPQFAFPADLPATSPDDVEPVDQPGTILPSGQVPTPVVVAPIVTTPVVGTILPSGQVPAPVVAPIVTTPVVDVEVPVAEPDTTLPGGQVVPTPVVAAPAPVVGTAPVVAAPVANVATGTTPAAASSAQGTTGALSFFMHDILGGTRPSGRVVTGIVANSDVNNLPFSKTNNQVFPINGGIPLNTLTGVINNNNMPFLVGLNGQQNVAGANSVIQNTGNNNVASVGNGNLPFVSAGQLPAGLTLQQVMFGSITVVDNELTEGHELDSAVLGKAQGFYLASSLDGTGHTLVLTALFHSGSGEHHEIEDTISFFGIHRTGSPESQIAVVGGTGKYEHAKGYATITTLHQQDQHTTDGVETITQFNVYLTYVI